jgi:hypothetical protein
VPEISDNQISANVKLRRRLSRYGLGQSKPARMIKLVSATTINDCFLALNLLAWTSALSSKAVLGLRRSAFHFLPPDGQFGVSGNKPNPKSHVNQPDSTD